MRKANATKISEKPTGMPANNNPNQPKIEPTIVLLPLRYLLIN
ncbi:Uncharacterised protein [Vibrio cholerae]|nr:Uncharacterised protein [Vibrio cholerae]